MVAGPSATDQRLAIGMSARILYVNGNGRTSERTIDIIRRYTSRDGVTYLRAWCRLRNEERTFRTDRVLAVLESRGPVTSATHPPRPRPVAPRRPVTVPSSHLSAAPRPRRHLFAKFLATTAALFVAAWLWSQAEEAGSQFIPPPTPISRPAPPPSPPSQTVVRVEPAPKPAPRPDEVHPLEYRGQRIEARRTGGHTTYTLIVSGRTYESIHDARVAINTSLLSARTGITHPDVIDLFAWADGNQDGEVSWEEMQRFQSALDLNYRYELNPTALRPDEFMAAGGGDCEDWALMTAGMLQFWGIPVFIGSLSSSTGHHAIALVPTTRVPPGAMTIDIPAGGSLRAGSYVPIDYEHVGCLSNAVAREFTVERIWVPEEIYGWSI